MSECRQAQQNTLSIFRFTKNSNGIRLLDEVDFDYLIKTLLTNLADGESFTHLTGSCYQQCTLIILEKVANRLVSLSFYHKLTMFIRLQI